MPTPSSRTAAVALAAGLLLAGCGSPTAPAEQADELATGLVDQLPTAYGLGDPVTGDQPAPGVLITPHSAQRLTAVSVSDELDQSTAGLLGTGTGDRQVAPEGHDVVVASLTATDLTPPFRPDPDQGVEVTTEIVVGDERTPVEPFSGYLGNGAGSPSVWTQPDTTLVVVAPVDTPVLYSVTEEGETASIDLRTGQRADDDGTTAGAVYYTQRFAPVVGEASGVGSLRLPDGTVADPATAVTVSLADRSVVLSPWLPGRGWAAPGRVWASLDLGVELQANAFGSLVEVSVDPSTAFTLTGADGVAVPALAGTSSTTPQFSAVTGSRLGAVWDLAAGPSGGTVDIALDPTFSYQDAPWSWDGPTLAIPGVTFSFTD